MGHFSNSTNNSNNSTLSHYNNILEEPMNETINMAISISFLTAGMILMASTLPAPSIVSIWGALFVLTALALTIAPDQPTQTST